MILFDKIIEDLLGYPYIFDASDSDKLSVVGSYIASAESYIIGDPNPIFGETLKAACPEVYNEYKARISFYKEQSFQKSAYTSLKPETTNLYGLLSEILDENPFLDWSFEGRLSPKITVQIKDVSRFLDSFLLADNLPRIDAKVLIDYTQPFFPKILRSYLLLGLICRDIEMHNISDEALAHNIASIFLMPDNPYISELSMFKVEDDSMKKWDEDVTGFIEFGSMGGSVTFPQSLMFDELVDMGLNYNSVSEISSSNLAEPFLNSLRYFNFIFNSPQDMFSHFGKFNETLSQITDAWFQKGKDQLIDEYINTFSFVKIEPTKDIGKILDLAQDIYLAGLSKIITEVCEASGFNECLIETISLENRDPNKSSLLASNIVKVIDVLEWPI